MIPRLLYILYWECYTSLRPLCQLSDHFTPQPLRRTKAEHIILVVLSRLSIPCLSFLMLGLTSSAQSSICWPAAPGLGTSGILKLSSDWEASRDLEQLEKGRAAWQQYVFLLQSNSMNPISIVKWWLTLKSCQESIQINRVNGSQNWSSEKITLIVKFYSEHQMSSVAPFPLC